MPGFGFTFLLHSSQLCSHLARQLTLRIHFHNRPPFVGPPPPFGGSGQHHLPNRVGSPLASSGRASRSPASSSDINYSITHTSYFHKLEVPDACLGFIPWTGAGHGTLSCWTAPHTCHEIGKDLSVESLPSRVNTMSVLSLLFPFLVPRSHHRDPTPAPPQAPEPTVWGPTFQRPRSCCCPASPVSAFP